MQHAIQNSAYLIAMMCQMPKPLTRSLHLRSSILIFGNIVPIHIWRPCNMVSLKFFIALNVDDWAEGQTDGQGYATPCPVFWYSIKHEQQVFTEIPFRKVCEAWGFAVMAMFAYQNNPSLREWFYFSTQAYFLKNVWMENEYLLDEQCTNPDAR